MEDTFLKLLYPTVEKNLKVKSGQFVAEVARFIDSRSSVLSMPGPSKRLYFSPSEKNVICRHMGITLEDCQDALNKCPLQEQWYKSNVPFNIACSLAIRYYTLNRRERELNMALTALGLSMYAGQQFHYFPYEPNENIMNYTINNLSNKFKIKQLGNILKAVQYTIRAAHDTYKEDIIKGTDEDIRKYVTRLATRINQFVKKIVSEFHEVKNKGLYLNTETDDYSEENYHVTSNNSLAIARIAESIALKIVSQPIQHGRAEMAARSRQISTSALKNAINEILKRYDDEIKELVQLILQLFLEDGTKQPRMIRSQAFFVFCSNVYLKSNTMDNSIIRIKNLLDRWLTETSENYTKTERIATKNNFRAALYFYFVLVIMNCYE